MPEEKNLFQLVKSAQKILIIYKGVLVDSDIANISNLLSYLQSLSKQFQFLCIEKQSKNIEELSKNKGIDITYELKPTEYVVTIDYASSGVEKVVYDTDKENGKLVFKILPTKNGFSFDNVKFQEGSSKFDGTILVGIDNPKDLGKFFDDNEYLFKESSYIKFTNSDEITEILLNSEEVFDPQFIDIFTNNIVSGLNIIEGILEPEQQDILVKVLNLGGNLSKSIVSKYYNKEEKYLKLFKYLLSNTQTSGEVIFSIVRKENLKEFTFEDIKSFGRIPFNIVEKYKLALILFELQDERMYLVVESNDPSRFNASTIAGVFGGKGDSGHAYCKVDDMKYEEIEKRFWPILNDLYNIEVGGDTDSKNVDNVPRVLTKRHKNSKLKS